MSFTQHNASSESTNSSSPISQKKLRSIIILGSLSAFGPLCLDMYLPALPHLATDLNTTASMAQLSLTACLLGLALGQLIVGPLSDTRGRRLPLVISLIIFAISSLLCIFTPTASIFNVLRFIQGLSGSAGIVISRAVVRDMYSGTEMTKFFSMLMLVNGAAPILAPLFGGQLLGYVSWRGVFVVLSLIGVLLLLSVICGLPETLPLERRQSGGLQAAISTFSRLLRDRLFMGYCLSQAFVTAAMFGYISGSSFVLQNIYNLSEQSYSYVFAINGVGIIAASQITGRLAGRIHETILLRYGMGLATCASIALLLAILMNGNLISILIPLFFIVSAVGIVGPSSFPLAMQSQEKSAGSASALLGLLPYILGAAVAPLVGLGGENNALPMGIVITLANMIAVLSYLFMVKPIIARSERSSV